MMSTVSCAPSLRASSRRPAGPPIDDQAARAADLGRDQTHHPYRAGPLYYDRVADLYIAAQRDMHADRKRFGQDAYLRRRLQLNHARLRVRQIDIVGEATAERLIRAAIAVDHAAVAGMKDDPVSLFDRGTVKVGGQALAQRFDDADVFMPQHGCRLDPLLPVVNIGAADAA